MENPGELIRRAGNKRKLAPPRERMPEPPAQRVEPRPAPVSRHSSYTALMRSHDRMSTRHIPKQG